MPDLIQYIQPTSLIICLCVGFVLKNTKPFEKLANDYIPLIEVILGVICVVGGTLLQEQRITLELIATGAMTGVASVGLHQLFTRTVIALSGKESV